MQVLNKMLFKNNSLHKIIKMAVQDSKGNRVNELDCLMSNHKWISKGNNLNRYKVINLNSRLPNSNRIIKDLTFKRFKIINVYFH
jgi:16S rRNA U1498 N3-methylase RsmE